MLSYATKLDPLVYFIAVFPISLAALALGYAIAARFGKTENEKAESAFGLGQAAIFALIALILAFSFSFASQRYEARRALVVNEADAISTAYLRASFIPEAASAARFRDLLIEYTRTRLQTYAEVADVHAEVRSTDKTKALQAQLWTIASDTARRNPRSPLVADIARSVDETIDVSEDQSAALTSHVPGPIIGIVLLCTILGAWLLGLTFGRAKAPNAMLAAIFCLLFAATVFTIIDLDHPQGGFIGVDIVPIQTVLNDMLRDRNGPR
jgi:uncharacterized membrane protein